MLQIRFHLKNPPHSVSPYLPKKTKTKAKSMRSLKHVPQSITVSHKQNESHLILIASAQGLSHLLPESSSLRAKTMHVTLTSWVVSHSLFVFCWFKNFDMHQKIQTPVCFEGGRNHEFRNDDPPLEFDEKNMIKHVFSYIPRIHS